MAERLIKEVQTIELKADKIISEAREQAERLLADAAAKAKADSEAVNLNAKKKAAVIIGAAENAAAKEQLKMTRANEAQCRELAEKTAPKMKKAVQAIVMALF
ncbi:MAG TPA: hypothetical protein DEQ02_07795 [Ruminococcaceae bacterium]|nr:hypothetical protein [Oscillospiraceae bacterium]